MTARKRTWESLPAIRGNRVDAWAIAVEIGVLVRRGSTGFGVGWRCSAKRCRVATCRLDAWLPALDCNRATVRW